MNEEMNEMNEENGKQALILLMRAALKMGYEEAVFHVIEDLTIGTLNKTGTIMQIEYLIDMMKAYPHLNILHEFRSPTR